MFKAKANRINLINLGLKPTRWFRSRTNAQIIQLRRKISIKIPKRNKTQEISVDIMSMEIKDPAVYLRSLARDHGGGTIP